MERAWAWAVLACLVAGCVDAPDPVPDAPASLRMLATHTVVESGPGGAPAAVEFNATLENNGLGGAAVMCRAWTAWLAGPLGNVSMEPDHDGCATRLEGRAQASRTWRWRMPEAPAAMGAIVPVDGQYVFTAALADGPEWRNASTLIQVERVPDHARAAQVQGWRLTAWDHPETGLQLDAVGSDPISLIASCGAPVWAVEFTPAPKVRAAPSERCGKAARLDVPVGTGLVLPAPAAPWRLDPTPDYLVVALGYPDARRALHVAQGVVPDGWPEWWMSGAWHGVGSVGHPVPRATAAGWTIADAARPGVHLEVSPADRGNVKATLRNNGTTAWAACMNAWEATDRHCGDEPPLWVAPGDALHWSGPGPVASFRWWWGPMAGPGDVLQSPAVVAGATPAGP